MASFEAITLNLGPERKCAFCGEGIKPGVGQRGMEYADGITLSGAEPLHAHGKCLKDVLLKAHATMKEHDTMRVALKSLSDNLAAFREQYLRVTNDLSTRSITAGERQLTVERLVDDLSTRVNLINKLVGRPDPEKPAHAHAPLENVLDRLIIPPADQISKGVSDAPVAPAVAGKGAQPAGPGGDPPLEADSE